MKTAICYSGQIGAIHKAYEYQLRHVLIPNQCDIFCYTSDAVSQKDNCEVNIQPSGPVREYLEAEKGWRKNYKTYGIIYNVDEEMVQDAFVHFYGTHLKDFRIEPEYIAEKDHDVDMTKWEWMKMRQLYKMKQCNMLLKESAESYDIVIRSRFEFIPVNVINVEEIIDRHGGIEKNRNSVFVFGGFKCSPPMIFMDEYFCDGFIFGTPEVMDVVCSIADLDNPYPPNPKYVSTWEKWGDSIEHQFRSHMLENNIEIKYISNSRQDYIIVR